MPTPKARYEITADDKTAAAWRSALGHAQQFANNIKSVLLPLASGAAFGAFVRGAVSAADAIGDAADRAGVLASDLSRLKYVADQSDVSFESLTVGIRKLQDNISNAANGVKASEEALSALNLTGQRLKGLKLDEQLGIIAEEFKGLTSAEDKTRVATDLFGRSGAELIPLLDRGKVGIRELAAEADRLGITLDDTAVKSIDRATKALDRFWSAVKGGTANRTGTLIADIFGSGDELLDIQGKIENLTAQRTQFIQGAGELNEQEKFIFATYDAQIGALRSALDVRTQEIAAAQKLAEIESGRRQAFGTNAQRRKEEQAEFWAMINAPIEGPRVEELNNDQLIRDREEVLKEIHERELDLDALRLQELGALERGTIDQVDEYMKASRQEAQESASADIKALGELQIERIDEVSEYEREAQRETQNAIARGLRAVYRDGLDGLEDAFKDTVADMAIEAASARLAEALFGTGTNGSSGNDGWIQQFIGWVGSYFNNSGSGNSPSSYDVPRYASGGAYPGNQVAMVGEDGPELFMSKSAGTIIPNHMLGGVSLKMGNIYIGAGNNVTESGVRRVVKEEIGGALKAMSEQARRGR